MDTVSFTAGILGDAVGRRTTVPGSGTEPTAFHEPRHEAGSAAVTAFDPPPVKVPSAADVVAVGAARGRGCRCVCAFYHPRRGLPGSVCLDPAEPGLLVRVETEGEVSGPLPVCRPCYEALGE
ncbi:DUF6372 family protein [Nocardia farcinica]|uniref:DUF6372 family protein n=1 Tax=Nocardia farcinica TaxID=37329 RepID=UPI003CC7E94B